LTRWHEVAVSCTPRYSGGEQDLAGLCLRLALSRTIAEAEFRQVFVVSHIDDVMEHCD
jgi:hypothetical protein